MVKPTGSWYQLSPDPPGPPGSDLYLITINIIAQKVSECPHEPLIRWTVGNECRRLIEHARGGVRCGWAGAIGTANDGQGWKVCPVILDNSIKPSPAGHLRASVSDRLKWTLFEGRGWLLSVAKTKQQKKG